MYGYVDADGGQIECIYTGFQQASGFVTYPNWSTWSISFRNPSMEWLAP